MPEVTANDLGMNSEMQPETHVLIIWSEGLSEEDNIINSLRTRFHILQCIRVAWSDNFFFENLKRFYAHSHKDKDEAEYDEIIKRKMDSCGSESFVVVVFQDENPMYEYRNTTNGHRKVNSKVFDTKSEFRSRLGGKNIIHASDNIFEANRDVSLLFGITAPEFVRRFSDRGAEETQYNNNVIGVPEWNSLEEAFFALNQAIRYVVLRNFEYLPDNYVMSDHGDIDILCEDLRFIVYLTGAKDQHPDDPKRVHYRVPVAGYNIPFDFRYISDNYYDKRWELDILRNRVLHPKGFYVPNEKDLFYSVLYHAYIHKKKVAFDYRVRLASMARQVGVEYSEDTPDINVLALLNEFVDTRGYSYPLPEDVSVFFNQKFVEKGQSDSRHEGHALIASQISRTDEAVYVSDVYDTPNGILKTATNPQCQNEHRFLSRLQSYDNFPQIVSFQEGEQHSDIVLEKIDGISFEEIHREQDFWKPDNVLNFIDECLTILIRLADNNILHRDICRDNFIFKYENGGYRPVLIDFSWSMDLDDRRCITPENLGGKYKFKGVGFSDAYSMGKCLSFAFPRLKCASRTIKKLSRIEPADYVNGEEVVEKLKRIREEFREQSQRLPLHDRMVIEAHKHYRISSSVLSLARAAVGR